MEKVGLNITPKEFAGAKCGKPMTFEQANNGRANPHFEAY